MYEHLVLCMCINIHFIYSPSLQKYDSVVPHIISVLYEKYLKSRDTVTSITPLNSTEILKSINHIIGDLLHCVMRKDTILDMKV